MPRNVYWEIYYHIVWHTKQSMHLLTPTIEPPTPKYLLHRALETPDTTVHAIGGIETHVHLAVSLPPTTDLSKWIGDLKGASAHHINHGPAGLGSLAWQTGYGIVTFGKGDLPWVVEYIRNQRQHHASGKTTRRLERTINDETASVE